MIKNEVPEEGKSVLDKPFPEDEANIFSKITFWWLNPLMKLSYSRLLEKTDLYAPKEGFSASFISSKFQSYWDDEVRKVKEGQKKKENLLLVLYKAFNFDMYVAGLLKIVNDVCQVVAPLLVKWIIAHLKSNDEPAWIGYIYVCCLFLVQIIASITLQHFAQRAQLHGFQMKTALSTAIYRKSLKLSNQARQKLSSGEIFNLMSIDSSKFEGIGIDIHLLWSSFFQMILSLIMVFTLIGVSTLAGIAVIILVIPINSLMAKLLLTIRKQLMEQTGKRMKLMNEMLQGIRIIKFNAWENSFIKKVTEIRNHELFITMKGTIVSVFVNMFAAVVPVFVLISTFSLYTGIGGELSAEVIFPVLSYFTLLRYPATYFPLAMAILTHAKVSLKRIQDFLMLEELEEKENDLFNSSEFSVEINDGNFIWAEEVKEEERNSTKEKNEKKDVVKEKKEEKGVLRLVDESENQEEVTNEESTKKLFKLEDINLSVKKGDLVMVVGLVGSGKSSLLSSILGEMKLTNGNLSLNGTVAYVSQQAWIRNTTIRENITFGLPFDEQKYEKAIEVASLSHDLELFEAGDMTEIGEKGITLSGGQKQRLSLARAIYADADIYLLDDVLSALDQHVGRYVFDKCIVDYLKGKTRILITHQWQYLKDADHIVVMKDGKIFVQGNHEQLNNQQFSSMLSYYIKESKEEEQEEQEEKEVKKEVTKKETTNNSKLIQAEEREQGSVKFSVYYNYLTYCGGRLFLFILLILYTINQASQLSTSWFLAYWSKVASSEDAPKDGRDSGSVEYNVYVYIGIFVATGFITAIVSVITDALAGFSSLRAAKKLYETMLTKVLHSPTSFFDMNPIGRILNRFSKDTESIDFYLINCMQLFFQNLFSVLGALVIVASVTPLFIIPAIPILIGYAFVANYFRAANRELKRLDSNCRSPLFAHFNETLTGVSTIRAYKKQVEFTEDYNNLLDVNNVTSICQFSVTRWLGIRIEFLGAVIIASSALFCLFGRGSLNAAMAGLSLTYGLNFTSVASRFVRIFSETEARMNAVERVTYYCESISQEKLTVTEDEEIPPSDWPQKGEIEFDEVYLKYREELNNVLKGLSFKVNEKEKIGICGRTGSGKSTIMISLFRLTELSKGKILIDGIDISKINVYFLRSIMAIIPQDPVLFSGTIRFNLDPFDNYSDHEIWLALERAHIKDVIKELPNGLDANVTEFGENFSVGQKQLLCLARAILRKTKILVMDEATASIDMETDKLIKETVRNEFSDRTVLTIAHRLDTIIDSSRVLVLADGKLAEYDTPKALLSNEYTLFSDLINETGITNASSLKAMVFEEK
ncbi:hypothetical protein ABK040_010696 [Willaertia magna]